jgi:sugar-specific transcriptional regulator TrmB
MNSKEKILNYLKKLDLSDLEADIYLNLANSGPISVRDLAKASGIKRTTAYLYIDQLVEKGLAMKIVKSSKKQVAASPPEQIQQIIQEKLTTIQSLQKNYPDILKTLNTMSPQPNPVEAEIKYFKGVNSIKTIYEEALKSKELRSYANLAIMEKVFPENLYIFTNGFRKNLDLKIYEIVEDSASSRKQTQFSSKNNRYFYKFLPSDIKLSATDILIYDNKVAIINVQNKITGMIIKNPEYYINSKQLFDLNWRMLPDNKKD